MYYVAMLTITDADLNAKIRPAHLDYINDLYKQGKVVMAGPFTDKKGGMVIYKASSEEEARELAEADPVIKEGARTLELREWGALEFPLG
ncbi:YciI family protein [Brevibacillus ruminantium]|uniref:YciI family protein n=1 Tax=Brevibacillus ruminantium TaxID=2950604 RepID=A0ABY4WDN7_9BACL|nr:YciI family protein [Brevibacillus ruminantium]USG65300.1 YciI family protein [Brevibacillus ruminantium]